MLHVFDAGTLPYRPAWDMQLAFLEQVLSGEHPHGVLMLVEHPPVVTIGRRSNAEQHLLASPAMLKLRGVEVVETDRGGDVTFHGPGQLVVYPIIPLNTYNLNLHSYMRLLEQATIDTLAAFNIVATRDTQNPPATGVWVPHDGTFAKIAAIGIKVRRWITLHGLALNVSTDLTFFDLINPCGLSRPVISIQKILGPTSPDANVVKPAITGAFQRLLRA
jgi:lipoyl(octanoyl) transferase